MIFSEIRVPLFRIMLQALDGKEQNRKQTRAYGPGLQHQATGLAVAYS
jgi:hypothetical protein